MVAKPAPHPARFIEPVPDDGIHNDHGALRRFLADVPAEARLLDLGSGSRRLRPGVLNLDIVANDDVDIVGDGHRLPFRDRSFDAVVLQTVIEHVLEPETVIAETARVLVPGGRAYIEAPFLYPVHGDADYYRWTRKGLEYVVGKHLDILDSGLTLGPASTLSLTWRGFIEARMSHLHWAVRNWIAWATSWLPRLEGRTVPDQATVYATTYVVARARL
ncbi:MAG TPA: class I SAM-dependent methyltransferase [Candidatus Dormibacteraeota bacterium]